MPLLLPPAPPDSGLRPTDEVLDCRVLFYMYHHDRTVAYEQMILKRHGYITTLCTFNLVERNMDIEERPEDDEMPPFSEVIDVTIGESLGIFETDLIANKKS